MDNLSPYLIRGTGQRKIIIFSDLHLADSLYNEDDGLFVLKRGGRDDFCPFALTLSMLYEEIVEHGDIVIFNGDTLELNQCSSVEIKGAYQWLLQKIVRVPSRVIFITGNHDPVHPLWLTLQASLGNDYHKITLPPRPFVILEDQKLGLTHGDMFDPIISKNRKLAWAIGKLGGLLEKVRPDVDLWFSKTMDKLKKIGRHSNSDNYLPHLIELANKYRLNKMVYGHTHHTRMNISGGVAVANPGCWVDANHLGYIVVDNDEIALKRVTIHEDHFIIT